MFGNPALQHEIPQHSITFALFKTRYAERQTLPCEFIDQNDFSERLAYPFR